MPEADGYDFISAVRSMESSAVAQIPAIAVTAMARPEDTQKALSAGFQSHISKPIDFEELIALIARLLPKQAEALPT
jgi:CheY-like chemotaxis protein